MKGFSVPRDVLVASIAVLVVIFAGGAWFYQTQKQQTLALVEAELEAVAYLKITQIVAWRRERISDATVLMHSAYLREGMARFLATGNAEDGASIRERLEAMCEHYSYDDAMLVDTQGEVLLRISGGSTPLCQETKAMLPRAFQARRPLFVDLHRGAGHEHIHIGIVVPCFTDGRDQGDAFGAVVFESRADTFLFPLVQSWPTPSATAETTLVRHDGDAVLFLCDLRHQPDTALRLRIPLEREDVPAVKAVRGWRGLVSGVDYRGVAVVSVIAAIPDSPWFMVAKVDASEAYALWRFRSGLILLLILLAAAAAAATAGMVWQRRRSDYYQDLLRSRQELSESERRFRLLVEGAPDAIFVQTGGRFAYVNAAALVLFGADSADRLIGHDVFERFHPDHHGATRERIEALTIRKQKVPALEEVFLRLDGGEVPVEVSAVPMYYEGSDGAVIFARDIFDRIQSQQALRASERFARSTVDALIEHIAILDDAGLILSVNRAWRAFADANPLVLVNVCDGANYLDACDRSQPPCHEEASEVAAGIRAIIRGERDLFETEYPCHAPDEQRWFIVRVSRFQGEGPVRVVIAHENITRRKVSEKRVEHLNLVLRAIRDVNQLIVHERDRERLIHMGCRILVEQRSYSSAMIVLTDAEDRPVGYAQAGMDTAFAPLAESLDRGELPFCCLEARRIRTVVLIEDRGDGCASCPVVAACANTNVLCICLIHEGVPFGYLAVAVDPGIAQSPEEQELFVEMGGDLAFALYAMAAETARLKADKERLVLEGQLLQAQRMESIGRLAGGVAHDFNNMLAAILGYTELAMEEVGPDSPALASLEEVWKAGTRSADLTRQLLAFARKQTIEPRILDLNDTVTGLLKMLGRLIGEDINLLWQPRAGLDPVKMDPAQIDQILANLVVNARDAIDGVGKVTIETGTAEFDEDYCAGHLGFQPGTYVLLAVSDNGVGMDQATLGHIFEPFFTTKQSGKGTGLGLAMVYGIVKQNKGFINVYSEPDRGTTIRIYLPPHAGEVESREPRPPLAEKQVGTETVLLVEDEQVLLDLTRKQMEQLGYVVLHTTSPTEALQLVAAYEGVIHLMLTDVVMPEMSGRDLWEAVVALRPNMKCLFMSGYTANVIAHHGVLDEGVLFIQKPFSAEALAAKLRVAIES